MKKMLLPLILVGILIGWVRYSMAEVAGQVLLNDIDVITSADNTRIELKFEGTPGEYVTSYRENFLQMELHDTYIKPPKQWINVKDGFFKNVFVYQFDNKTVRARFYSSSGDAINIQDKIKFSNEGDRIVLLYNISGGVSAGSSDSVVKSDTQPLASVLKGDVTAKQLIPKTSGPPEIYGSFFKMILVLGLLVSLLLVVLYVVKRFFWKKMSKGGVDESIRVITSAYVGPKKSIALVEVAGERIVVGITNDNISMLTKVNKDMEFNAVLREQISIIPDEKPDEKPDANPDTKPDENKVEINDELWEKA